MSAMVITGLCFTSRDAESVAKVVRFIIDDTKMEKDNKLWQVLTTTPKALSSPIKLQGHISEIFLECG